MSVTKQDKHFPTIALDNPLRRFFSNPRRYCAYVSRDQTVADPGCGPGFFTLALAESAGPGGKVYAVDSDERALRARYQVEERNHPSPLTTGGRSYPGSYETHT